MTWWLWTLCLVLALPIVSVLMGALLLLLATLAPPNLLPSGCGCCGKTGYWTRRSGTGAHLCDDCMGTHEHSGITSDIFRL
jgi:hypothetical protein